MSWNSFFVISHIIGTALGVGGATFAEVFLLKSLRDGKVDETEGGFLRLTYWALRLGMIILVLSGFGFFLLYRFESDTDHLYEPALWAKMTIVLVILINALLLETRKIPLWLGSALSLTSWYAALVIGASGQNDWSYGEVMLWYVLAVAIVAGLLSLVRKSLKIKI